MAVPLRNLLFFLGFFVAQTLAVPELEELRLLDYLRQASSHPFARPVEDSDDAVEVNFRLSLRNLDIDEKKETLYAHHWFSYTWKDLFLTWNPANFSGISSVRIPIDAIWKPDIDVYNSHEETRHEKTSVVLYSDGTINYVARMHTTTTCVLDLTYFPYDVQKCRLIIGSWTFDGRKLNLTMPTEGAMDVSDYTPNKAWKLIDTSAVRRAKKYDCCDPIYISLRFYITLARESAYFTYVYIGPVAILSLLGAAIFILPPGNAQKMSLGGALLICYGLFFLDVSYVLPPVHSSTPTIDKYYMAMYIMLALSVALSAFVTNLAERSWTHSQPPEIVKTVLLAGLGRVLCVSDTPSKDFGTEEISDVKVENSSGGGKHPSQKSQVIEWYLIATVLDRLALVVYILLTVLLAFSILFSYPKA